MPAWGGSTEKQNRNNTLAIFMVSISVAPQAPLHTTLPRRIPKEDTQQSPLSVQHFTLLRQLPQKSKKARWMSSPSGFLAALHSRTGGSSYVRTQSLSTGHL